MDPTEDESTETPATPETPESTEALPSLFDAVNDALDPLTPKEELAADETEETEEGEESEEAEEGAAERNADGTYKAKSKDEPADAAVKPAADPAKKTDPVNDPIPEEIKGRTRERMTALIDTVKAKDVIIADQHTVFSAVQATGASPEEFAAMISYMGWAHSADKGQLAQARDMLLTELEGISLKLGEPAPGINFIAKHPDIQQMVDNGQITQEVAQELAMRRTSEAAAAERATTTSQATEQQRQRATAERNTAIADLDQLGATLQENDPDFAEKMKLMPDLKELGKGTAPGKWRGAFQAAYKAAGATLAQQRQGNPRPSTTAKPTGQQPLRANKSPSGGQNRQPTSLLDAVNSALDQHANGN